MTKDTPDSRLLQSLLAPEDPRGKTLAALREYGSACQVGDVAGIVRRRFGLSLEASVCLDVLEVLRLEGEVEWDGDPSSSVVAIALTPLLVPGLGRQETEAGLMTPLEHHLETTFRKASKVGEGDFYLPKDTSTMGPKKGVWRRPDFMVAHVALLPVSGRRHLDVHSFELKKEAGCDLQSVYETLSHTRYTHYGHLVWYLPVGSPHEGKLDEVVEHCQDYGLGFVRMTGHSGPDAFRIEVRAKRKHTSDPAVEEFLLERLAPVERRTLRLAMGIAR